ncbi:MAG: cytochrome c3 family protein [Myxococcaceae bacterium]
MYRGNHAWLLLAAIIGSAAAWAGDLPASELDQCLDCHEDKTLTKDLPSGESQSLFIDREVFGRSVHGAKLHCTDCHADISDVPHEERPFNNKRELSIAYYEACKRCHFANYTKTLDGIHYQLIAKGRTEAALCVDCHGAHDITRPGEPRSHISQTCAKCHRKVSETYGQSVHGRALLEGENADVPVCTDCHKSHDIADPRTSDWRVRSPEICGGCHTDPKRMDKYGLSTKVLQTYLSDFHGVTSSMQKDEPGTKGGKVVAVCTDCHGVHDIAKVKDPTSKVVQANLVQTCQKCHPDASANFPATWLSHYEPTFEKSPLVFGVEWFYRLFIPFIIGGLVLQIALHLWRVVVNR